MSDSTIKSTIFILALLLFSLQSCHAQEVEDNQLSAKEFQEQLGELSSTVQLIDVRTPEEFSEGHLEGAVNMNIKDEDFEEKIKTLHRDQSVFVYCLRGGRSEKAAAALSDLEFTQVYDLKGGIMAWKNENLPVTRAEKPAKPDAFTRVDFDKLLNENEVVLIDFYADWCIPCKEMEPSIAELTKEYDGKALVYRINIDEAKSLTSAMKIEGIPVFHLYKKGKLIKELQGLQEEKELKALLESI